MPSKQELEALLERVEKAETSELEVDCLLYVATHKSETLDYFVTQDHNGRSCVGYSRNGPLGQFLAPSYTFDINTILALVGDKLPGWRATIVAHEDGRAMLERPGFDPIFRGHANTPALALCIAFIKALIAEAGDV